MSNQPNKIGVATGIAAILSLMLLGSSFLTITQGISLGGYMFFVALGISYVLMMCQATSFAELSGMMPSEGAVYNYVTAGFGRFMGVTATLAAYIIVTAFAASAEVAVAGIFARENFPFLEFIPANLTWIIGWFVVILCMIINLRGLSMYALIENIMSYFKYIVMVIIGLVGLFIIPKVGELPFIWGESMIGSDTSALFALVGLTLFLFVGAEYVTPLAPEMKNHERNIPRSLFYGLTLSLVAMLIFGTAITRQVPNEIIETLADGSVIKTLETPESALMFGDAVLGTIGKWFFAIIIFVATVALINTIIASIPRILYGMAQDGMLPKIFTKLHPKHQTPWFGILFVGVIPMVGAFLVGENVDGVFSLILSAICSWIFFYALINFSVIALRRRRKDLARPYKIPFYPLPQIVALVGLVITFIYLTPPFLTAQQIYIPFLIMLGLCATYAFFTVKKDRWKPVEPEELMKNES